MLVTITSIELKGPLQFFALSKQAMYIIKQLKSTDCKAYKSTGFWTKHYTMTLWKNEEELKTFARSGPHLAAMKQSGKIAKEIRTFTYQSDSLPKWKEAKIKLQAVEPLRYD